MNMKRAAFASFLLIASASISTAQVQDHVVSLPEARQALSRATSERASNIADIERLLSRPESQQELAKARITSGQALKAISVMSDEELARLAAKARSPENDVQGGLLKTLLAIIGAITVIIIVVAILA